MRTFAAKQRDLYYCPFIQAAQTKYHILFINVITIPFMKKIYLFAAMAAMLASCSSDDVTTEMQTAKQSAENVAVSFDAYVPRTTTRAGQTGELKNDADGLQTSGFGVFGYYTNADNYDQSFTPNFMYNQQVEYSSSAWSYSPLKYWPNEFGSYAQSDDADKVSFFAYAPFVSVNPTSGKVNGDGTVYTEDNGDITMGIVGMKNNAATGDPMVKYISTFYTDKQVDLLWGTVATESNSWGKKNGGGTQVLPTGLPFLDVQHPYNTSTSQPVKFDFKHGLAALNVTVDTKVNGTDVSNVKEPTNTKVYIRSVTFEGFDTKGALNLNNSKAGEALWYNFNCEDELNNGNEVTIKDGRKDGKEGITEATKEYAVINPVFVQSKVWGTTGETAGVTGTPANLFRTSDGSDVAGDALIYVIPNSDKLKVTIEYDVLTADDNLAGTLNDGQTKGSVVKNVITRYITADGKGSTSTGNITLVNGKKYTISLHLGLNSVEFDADVTGWDDPAVTGGADLPHNN